MKLSNNEIIGQYFAYYHPKLVDNKIGENTLLTITCSKLKNKTTCIHNTGEDYFLTAKWIKFFRDNKAIIYSNGKEISINKLYDNLDTMENSYKNNYKKFSNSKSDFSKQMMLFDTKSLNNLRKYRKKYNLYK